MSSGERLKLVETATRAVAADLLIHNSKRGLKQPTLPDAWRTHISALWLAGILAADPRRMSSVVADHIGTGLELPLAVLKNDAARLESPVLR